MTHFIQKKCTFRFLANSYFASVKDFTDLHCSKVTVLYYLESTSRLHKLDNYFTEEMNLQQILPYNQNTA